MCWHVYEKIKWWFDTLISVLVGPVIFALWFPLYFAHNGKQMCTLYVSRLRLFIRFRWWLFCSACRCNLVSNFPLCTGQFFIQFRRTKINWNQSTSTWILFELIVLHKRKRKKKLISANGPNTKCPPIHCTPYTFLFKFDSLSMLFCVAS